MSFFSFLLLKICWFSHWEEQQVAVFQHLTEEKVLQLCRKILPTLSWVIEDRCYSPCPSLKSLNRCLTHNTLAKFLLFKSLLVRDEGA